MLLVAQAIFRILTRNMRKRLEYRSRRLRRPFHSYSREWRAQERTFSRRVPRLRSWSPFTDSRLAVIKLYKRNKPGYSGFTSNDPAYLCSEPDLYRRASPTGRISLSSTTCSGLPQNTLHHGHATWRSGWCFQHLLGLLSHDCLGSENHARNRSCVDQAAPSHLCRVDDAGGKHVTVLIGHGIVALFPRELLHFLNNDFALNAGVVCNQLQRSNE
mmetsp:Transcript_13516/g.49175  ORF Transcript_13516/g.49175 Transcript_13516/m.49175 type:complete len:215 (-) Transcript_13516:1522-2166(-)